MPLLTQNIYEPSAGPQAIIDESVISTEGEAKL